MDSLKSNMEEIMNIKMEGLRDGLKIDLKRDLDGLTKLLQEILPRGDKVLHENNDEDNHIVG